jgi:hypothetical protein
MVSVVQRSQEKCACQGTKLVTVFGHERFEIKREKKVQKNRRFASSELHEYFSDVSISLRSTKWLRVVCKA